VITVDRDASGDNRCAVPLGGGFGTLFAIGTQRMHINMHADGNVVNPDIGPDWTRRLMLPFVFPT
jgi:hypothetical protein